MTGRPRDRAGAPESAGADGWHACVPELVIGVSLMLSTCAAVYAYFGGGAAAVTLTVWVAVLLVLLRWLVGAPAAPAGQQTETWRSGARTSLTGYWRKMSMLTDGVASMVSYDAELRPTLQHLAAARLAERHNVNLYRDPDTARVLLLGEGRSAALWFWLDPARPAETRQGQAGIPERTLAAILDRLDRL